ncbi:SF1B family DNA helicase RecD2 [Hydrogenimonas cancrithermarum]|uniref:ATP-dependent RecD-like DNA helicase n=1 Tax=Hydrogenimonas cancrithermarum TaxID=2993563 RepID=A0ABN6WRV2_9BACT|nr:AAA family ATPase [Hydrogenimonas cancrithermarum]BDY11796.1 ATP-dependent RecD-like DNA helicase [Hydrogenimonas cancrithermarum]
MKLTISGKIERILFQKESFLIAKLESGAKISGNCLITDIDALEGQEVELSGNWEEHPKFGPQFVFEELNIKGSELYFYLTKVVKGVGQKLVKRLIAHYGEEELLRILDEEPQKLLTFKGIKEKKLSQITQSWQRYKEMRELAMFLAPYRIGQSIVVEIYRTFSGKENLIDAIRENPYIVTQVKGVGFKRADEMARSMGIDARSPFRIEAAVTYLMREISEQQGNSAVERSHFVQLLQEELDFEDEAPLVEEVIDRLVEREVLHLIDGHLAHTFYYRAEKGIFDFLNARRENPGEPILPDIDRFIEKEEEAIGFRLGEEQREAVRLLNRGTRVMALVGYAGTGKSTSAKMMLKLLEERYGYDAIVTTALSGIAAQRIHDTTGYRSATIQSLLVAHKEKEALPYDVVLLDEASMVNSQIFFQLISKLKEDAVFLVIGDDGQLPPIGAGNVLSDIIKYELVPVVKLTKIYRQSEEQAITLIADAIRRAELPEYRKPYIDFKFVDMSIPDYYAIRNGMNESEKKRLREEHNLRILESIRHEAVPYILEARKKLETKDIRGYLTHIQVITPMRAGPLGVENLNLQLQKLFNPDARHAVEKGLYTYKLYDKVVHIKNENMPSYSPEGFKRGDDAVDQRIFNGMIGLIFKFDPEEEECFVFYPNEQVVVRYGFDTLSDYLQLAYALTIHKTQGMEYDTIIIPMSFSHYVMHNTKLLYTAVTRAKKMCIIVGEEAAFKGACRRIDTTKRTTILQLLAKKGKI